MRFLKEHMPAFSLIELSMVMIIMGLLAGAVFKGYSMIEAAKERAVVEDISQLRIAVDSYRAAYGMLPGNDSLAQAHFGKRCANGTGNGILSSQETMLFWQHLSYANLVASEKPPSSKIGGKFNAMGNPMTGFEGNWLVLSREEGSLKALLTPKQAAKIKAKAEGGLAHKGNIRFIEGADSPVGSCIMNEQFNLENTHAACICLISLDQ